MKVCRHGDVCVQVLTDYMVDFENCTAEEAAAAIESDIAAVLESLMTDELQEMAWDAEFGFGKDAPVTTGTVDGQAPPPPSR